MAGGSVLHLAERSPKDATGAVRLTRGKRIGASNQ
jgi:hypothetical protein